MGLQAAVRGLAATQLIVGAEPQTPRAQTVSHR